MMQNRIVKRLIPTVLALVMLLGLAACGGQGSSGAEDSGTQDSGASDTLKGIYDALVAPDSDYSEGKATSAEYYPEVEYTETLQSDRITLAVKANGNEYVEDGSWDFVEDGDYLTAVIGENDYTGILNVRSMGVAVGTYFGLDPDLVGGYLNGLGMPGIESDNFSMTEDEAAGTTTYKLSIAGPWDMKELDQMLLNDTILDADTLSEPYTSQGGSVGKLRYMANGSPEGYIALFAEYGELDEIAYQSIVNLITLRKPVGYEAFLADFTELKALDTDDYIVDLDPDDAVIEEIMNQERNEKFSYVLVRVGAEASDAG